MYSNLRTEYCKIVYNQIYTICSKNTSGMFDNRVRLINLMSDYRNATGEGYGRQHYMRYGTILQADPSIRISCAVHHDMFFPRKRQSDCRFPPHHDRSVSFQGSEMRY
jgi:hypothetical protein